MLSKNNLKLILSILDSLDSNEEYIENLIHDVEDEYYA